MGLTKYQPSKVIDVIPSKKIFLRLSRNQQTYEKTVSPGQTFRELMVSMGAKPQDYIVFKPSSGLTFKEEDVVYDNVSDQDVLHLNLKADVG